MSPEELGDKYGMVLLRTIELVNESQCTFQVAMQQAAQEGGHPWPLPEEVETAILNSAFRIVASGGIPGAPDA